MESTKKNTLVFEFPKDAPGPTLIEMSRFVKNFGADSRTMDTCYRNADEKCIFMRFKTEDAFNDAIVDNPEVHTFRYSDGKSVQVKMSVAGGFYRYIRIFNLSPEVEDADISRVLAKYGKIKKLVREKFPPECELDLYTGIRGAYVDVQKPIPASLFIRNSKARVYYEGLKNRCFHCKADDHLKANCPLMAEAKKGEEGPSGLANENAVSFAEALSSPKSVLERRLEALRASMDVAHSKVADKKMEMQDPSTSGAGSGSNEEIVETFDGDSLDDDSFDDKEAGDSGNMEVDDKASGTKRALIGVPSHSDSDGSNAGSAVQRSVSKKQRNEESKENASLGASPLEIIQNIPKDDTEKNQAWTVAQSKRNGGRAKRSNGKQ